MKCLECGHQFLEHTSKARYCSRECRYAVHKRQRKAHERKRLGYYDKRVKVLREAGYTVIPPKEKKDA